MDSEKGSALITVVLVVFVLTMVGIAGALYMTMEDRLSGNDKLQQTALYAAEDGLRVAEAALLNSAANSSSALNGLLCATCTGRWNPPGGGYSATPFVVNGTAYTNIPVTMPSGATASATYSIFIRNNLDDPAPATVTVDTDQKINLISVATVSDPTGRGITKVLEEQMFMGGAGGGQRLMKGNNMGGTAGAGIK